jgi:hypothetical protein
MLASAMAALVASTTAAEGSAGKAEGGNLRARTRRPPQVGEAADAEGERWAPLFLLFPGISWGLLSVSCPVGCSCSKEEEELGDLL